MNLTLNHISRMICLRRLSEIPNSIKVQIKYKSSARTNKETSGRRNYYV